jgi:hypothetical protein
MSEAGHYRHCSTCKSPIPYGGKYFSCSVTSCKRGPTALYFCSVSCWDAHVPDARHRDAWAEEEVAPTRDEYFSADAARETKKRTIVRPESGAVGPSASLEAEPPSEVLVVVSKLKAYVKAKSQMSTSDGVVDVLSDHLRDLATKAIRSAAQAGRKTVLDRDVRAVLRGEVAKD